MLTELHPPELFASFAVPAVAAGAAAAAVAVPVLIHLLNRHRYRVVEWAAIRFLLAAQKRHHRRVDHWLLLAARVLVLLLPLAAMCAVSGWAEAVWQWVRPGAAETVANAPRTHHVLVLDGSLSLATRPEDRPAWFERQVALAGQAVQAANRGDGFSLVYVAGPAQAVVPGPSNDPDKLLAELKALKPTHGTADAASALNLVADTLAKSPRSYPRRQVLFFTDLQRSAWAAALPKPDTAAPDVWQRILNRADVAAVDVARADTDNLAVTDVTLADPLPLADAPTAVTAVVQNFGRTDRRAVRVELRLGRPAGGGNEASLLPVEQRTTELIPAGGRSTFTFALDGPSRFREPGVHLLEVRLVEGDALAADDVRALAVEVRDGLPCLLVNGKAASDPFRRATEYLSEALAPGGRPAAGNPARPRTVSLAEFSDAALSDLSAVDCVFLGDLPAITPAQVARLEAHLKRGGGVVVGLGPNAAAAADLYNRLLYADGTGLLPGRLGGVVGGGGPDDPGFRLAAEEESYLKPPLVAFRDDNARAGLTGVPFKRYVKFDAPADGRGRRVLSFVPAGAKAGDGAKPDPAVVEWPRHRGRVVVYTSTFNADWTDWPVLPSYLPFVHELLRFAATNPDRHTVRVGEPIEDFLPVATVGLKADVTGPEGLKATVPVTVGDETGVVRFGDTTLAGVYRVAVGDGKDRVFAVNVPESSPGGGSESDLRRIDPGELRAVSPAIQVVTDPAQVTLTSADGVQVITVPKPHGPTIARWLLIAAVAVLLLELWLAWRLGPARAAGRFGGNLGQAESRGSAFGRLMAASAVGPLVVALGVVFAVLHGELTGQFLGFLPDGWRSQMERAAGVPVAAAGEGTRWRLEGFPAFASNTVLDRRLLVGLAAAGVALAFVVYRRERRATAPGRRLLLLFALRAAAVLLAALVLLPQLRLAFDREGWPDVAVLLDTSASMGTVDELQDSAVRAKAAELARAAGVDEADRLRLAKQLLTRKDADWITKLLTDRQVKVHVYSVADQARLVAEAAEPGDADEARTAIDALLPTGESSRLGDGVQAVLKAFRGGSLTAVVAFTDGQITAGDDWPRAAREAARAGVPLHLVGLGDAREQKDLVLSDLRAEDVVAKNDDLVFEARLTAKGGDAPRSVPVVLYEKQGDKLVEKGRAEARPDPAGKPVPVRVTHVPAEAGEKTFVLDVPAQPGEAETANNRIERVVYVTDNRRLKVLFVEGYPRYEFRFVKVLLERETEAVRGNKSIDLNTLLLDASKDHAATDKSALRAFPTRAELFGYDVVILGDVDPKQLPRPGQTFGDLADFVKQRGGGLVVVAGEQNTPRKLFDTPLADVLPVVPSDGAKEAGPTPEADPLADGYRMKLTPVGSGHPMFRFSADEAESGRVWGRLKPFFWAAGGYKRKPTAEVLAVHPDRPADAAPGENHPLALQQFVGGGRVLFFGFDETWRWRFRRDEERFNQFWVQAVRVAARNRVSRAELKTDKQTAYRRDEPIKVTVRFPDDAAPPAEGVAVKVLVERVPLKGGEPEGETVQLAKVEGTRATYQTLLTRTPEGEYRFFLAEPAAPGTRPRAEAKVLPPPGERERLDLNRAELARAAAESRGKFYTLADADTLIDDLPEGARVPLNQPCPPVPLWNHAGMFGLVVLLFAAEWLLRKRDRLL